MNRRKFLGLTLTALAAAGAAGQLEELLWTPEKKTIFIPQTMKLISVNVEATRACGAWHNGLRHPTLDYLTTMQEGALFAKYPDLVAPWEQHKGVVLQIQKVAASMGIELPEERIFSNGRIRA